VPSEAEAGDGVGPERVNAFTDGVIAIIITIMVLELHVPDGTGLEALRSELPTLGAYVLSFIYVGIYWNNHHHLMQSVKRIDGRVLWANLGLLFWLSLFPFMIRWVGEHGVTPVQTAIFGLVLFMAGAFFFILEQALIWAEGEISSVAGAVGGRGKEWLSVAIYALGVAISLFVSPWLAVVLYIAVAILWLVPDRRFERR